MDDKQQYLKMYAQTQTKRLFLELNRDFFRWLRWRQQSQRGETGQLIVGFCWLRWAHRWETGRHPQFASCTDWQIARNNNNTFATALTDKIRKRVIWLTSKLQIASRMALRRLTQLHTLSRIATDRLELYRFIRSEGRFEPTLYPHTSMVLVMCRACKVHDNAFTSKVRTVINASRGVTWRPPVVRDRAVSYTHLTLPTKRIV